MSHRMKTWGLPVASFLLAVLLALVAGPSSRAFSFRVAADPTGGCCHDLLFHKFQAHGSVTLQRIGLRTGTVFATASAETDSRGTVILTGQVNSGRLKIGPLNQGAFYELHRRLSVTSCKHTASVSNQLTAQYSDKVTPDPFWSLTKPHPAAKLVELYGEIATDFVTDLIANTNTSKAVGRKVEIEGALGNIIPFDIETKTKGNGAPELTFKVSGPEIDPSKGDDSSPPSVPVTFAQSKEFDEYAKFFIDSATLLELGVTREFLSAVGFVQVDIDPPGFRDSQEGVFIDFIGANTFRTRQLCDGGITTVDSLISEDQNKFLRQHIHFTSSTGK